MMYLVNKQDYAEHLLEKEMSKKFFRSEKFIENLIDMVSRYKADFWEEAYRVYPSIKENGVWACNGKNIEKIE